jgi:hypothetical protein
MTQGDHQHVDVLKSDAVMALLKGIAEGPAEAFAILVTCIYRLNFEFTDTSVSIDDLVAEIGQTLRSVSPHRKAN